MVLHYCLLNNILQDADDCEEWERHEATHSDPFKLQRKERLFEEDIEVVWEKGGSGLVFYTDAQYWDKFEGGMYMMWLGMSVFMRLIFTYLYMYCISSTVSFKLGTS